MIKKVIQMLQKKQEPKRAPVAIEEYFYSCRALPLVYATERLSAQKEARQMVPYREKAPCRVRCPLGNHWCALRTVESKCF